MKLCAYNSLMNWKNIRGKRLQQALNLKAFEPGRDSGSTPGCGLSLGIRAGIF